MVILLLFGYSTNYYRSNAMSIAKRAMSFAPCHAGLGWTMLMEAVSDNTFDKKRYPPPPS
jgi:hypothetical protein